MLLACKAAAPLAPASPTTAHAPAMQTTPTPPSAADRDNDGVLDANDLCPDEPEDLDHFEDEDGCVDRDNDGDGVLDAFELRAGLWTNCDRKLERGVEVDCRDRPETRDGIDDHDGCPEVLCLDQCSMRVADSVHFDRRGRFDGAADRLFDEVADSVRDAPRIHVWIDAHTDDGHDQDAARRLTEHVAAQAIAELVRRGVPRERLAPRGRGAAMPITRNRSAVERAANRRVEFNIMQHNGCCGAPPPELAPPKNPVCM
jgi:outer membrane protein OmpA-like peptidoglycan-associated protein